MPLALHQARIEESDGSLSLGGQVVAGDLLDDPMTVVAPGEAEGGGEGQDDGATSKQLRLDGTVRGPGIIQGSGITCSFVGKGPYSNSSGARQTKGPLHAGVGHPGVAPSRFPAFIG